MRLLLAFLSILLHASVTAAQVTYGDDGLELRSPSGSFSAVVGWRNQIRFSTPFGSPPEEGSDVGRGDPSNRFRLNRSRLKIEGHAFSPRVTYKFQGDFVEERIRDLNVNYEARDWLQVRAGWWKVEHLLERLQSSGSQELVDRSILDRWFTLGRQGGVQVHGRIGGRSAWGGHYYVGAFRNLDADPDDAAFLPVWTARYEWSHAGREMDGREQGDPRATRDLRLMVGTSAVRTEGAHAFYSGAGLGESLPVPGLPDTDLLPPGTSRFRTQQYAGDVVLKWRGVSAQAEIHRKRIHERATDSRRTVVGGYVMGGVLASTIWSRAPKPLELTARLALVDPARESDRELQQERVIGANWYLRAHRSKISVDVSRLRYDTPSGPRETDLRTRVQWEFTF